MIELKGYIESLPDETTIILEPSIIRNLCTHDLVNDISNDLGYKTDTIMKYIRSGRFSVRFIRCLNKYKQVISEIESAQPLFCSKIWNVRLPRFLTIELSYFIGYLQGDGSIESNKKRINFSDEYLSQLERINSLSIQIFNVKGKIYSQRSVLSKKPCYRLEIGSKVLNYYLHNYFGINRGVKNSLNIPHLIKNNRTLLRWYLVGLYDADGTLPKKPESCRQLFIDITMKDENFIRQIQDSLLQYDIATLKPYCRKAKSPNSNYISKTYELRIRKKKIMATFLNNLGFSHPDKSKRSKKMLLFLDQ